MNIPLAQATAHLSNNDLVLSDLIERYGNCTITPHNRHYEELASSIVSQQLSVKAAQTIWLRFLDVFGRVMPEPVKILATPDQALREVGLSYRKISYIKDLAQHIIDGRLELEKLDQLSNNEIITELVAVKGIGVWSAHMFMIFGLARLDVLAWGDLGVRKSAMIQYELPSLPTQKELEQISDHKNWHPYESVACYYLWKALDNK